MKQLPQFVLRAERIAQSRRGRGESSWRGIFNLVETSLNSQVRLCRSDYIQRYTDTHFYLVDFCISALECSCDQSLWLLLQTLVENCDWIFTFEKTCFVSERPLVLRYDSGNWLHAEGEPAIQFADGYSLYSYHGVRLPEKYGRVHPNQWESRWLLDEDNAGLRRVLIQSIGYARICQELQAMELDAWQEYTLLKIDAEADVESIVLLKMTCPSTGHIHILRVPPEMRSAREAIRWVNWDVDPEKFSIQT